jgi:hypothetical protein|tara:strand:- start:16 stop:204 length:189 start_codon:yes stop_codon:yes gene_type:complete
MNDAGSPGAISTTAKIIIEAKHRLIISEIALLRIYLSILNYLEKSALMIKKARMDFLAFQIY